MDKAIPTEVWLLLGTRTVVHLTQIQPANLSNRKNYLLGVEANGRCRSFPSYRARTGTRGYFVSEADALRMAIELNVAKEVRLKEELAAQLQVNRGLHERMRAACKVAQVS